MNDWASCGVNGFIAITSTATLRFASFCSSKRVQRPSNMRTMKGNYLLPRKYMPGYIRIQISSSCRYSSKCRDLTSQIRPLFFKQWPRLSGTPRRPSSGYLRSYAARARARRRRHSIASPFHNVPVSPPACLQAAWRAYPSKRSVNSNVLYLDEGYTFSMNEDRNFMIRFSASSSRSFSALSSENISMKWL